MRFVSKNSNLRIVLEPGLSAQPLSGFQGKQAIYVKFENGVVEIKDENLIQKMLQHRAYTTDGDFIAVGEDGKDPFIDRREEMEPVHVHTELKYGHVGASLSSPSRKTKINPELKKIVNDLAMKQVQELLPGMVSEGVKQVLAEMQARNKEFGVEQKNKETVSLLEEKEPEEDFSGLTVDDFLDDKTTLAPEESEGIVLTSDKPDEKTETPNGIKMSGLSPAAAAAASTIIGKKKVSTPKK